VGWVNPPPKLTSTLLMSAIVAPRIFLLIFMADPCLWTSTILSYPNSCEDGEKGAIVPFLVY
jgi:hypothetical protein